LLRPNPVPLEVNTSQILPASGLTRQLTAIEKKPLFIKNFAGLRRFIRAAIGRGDVAFEPASRLQMAWLLIGVRPCFNTVGRSFGPRTPARPCPFFLETRVRTATHFVNPRWNSYAATKKAGWRLTVELILAASYLAILVTRLWANGGQAFVKSELLCGELFRG
jgi:hypothetical protein